MSHLLLPILLSLATQVPDLNVAAAANGGSVFTDSEYLGATGEFANFTNQALYTLGRTKDADRIFNGMLAGYEDGVFQNGVGTGVDWKRWDGKPCGYEGLLTDSYYALSAFITGKLGRGVPIP